jgi:hypothetical protein
MAPPDAEVCVTLPSRSGFCQETLSDHNRLIPPAVWDLMQVGRFSLTAEDFGEYQSFVLRVCKKYKCTKKEKRLIKKKVRILYEALDRLD